MLTKEHKSQIKEKFGLDSKQGLNVLFRSHLKTEIVWHNAKPNPQLSNGSQIIELGVIQFIFIAPVHNTYHLKGLCEESEKIQSYGWSYNWLGSLQIWSL